MKQYIEKALYFNLFNTGYIPMPTSSLEAAVVPCIFIQNENPIMVGENIIFYT